MPIRYNGKKHLYLIDKHPCNFPVKTDIIRDAESDDVISFDLYPRTSGINRKLSVFTDFEAISSNMRVETGVIRDAE